MQKKFAFIRERIEYVLILLVTLIGSASAQSSVDEVIEKAWKGLGGLQNWQESRYYMFSYTPLSQDFTQGEQTFLWDRQNGQCRMDSKNTAGEYITVLFNTHRDKATVYVDKQLLHDHSITKDYRQKSQVALEQGSFWLFLPKRLEDAVQISDGGPELADGKRYDILLTTEAKATNGILHNKLYVDSQSGKIERWVALNSRNQPIFDFRIASLKDIGGGLLLGTTLTDYQNNKVISYPIATSLLDVEKDKFTKP